MQTNDTNGHQHEVSEKRLTPGTFPYRLDMELCACGAKRWVDQDGTPAPGVNSPPPNGKATVGRLRPPQRRLRSSHGGTQVWLAP